ncbi:probable pectinesterase/pectinesterase inhibitor 59 [Chenopodium quinoa]|uniref:Pectinesterase inhibitor domain-containing protein n=1 Tax=Chenopodium quinoa TaxID=63459 RepID=A0A803KT27_CHEQI|nr:probable pectinesterase/pectinesterase inhibitor 59 [Chenopodium quinoa]
MVSLNYLFLSLTIFASIACTFSEPEDAPLDDINKWCDTVPHPKTCKYFMARTPGVFEPKQKSDFKRMMVEAALDRAMAAQGHLWTWGEKCANHSERAAWSDCIRLYSHTIIQLNYTLYGLTSNSSFSDFDAQTWLSSSLTNLDTCMSGSQDMNVTSFIWPHVSYNVSDLISNGLAISEGLIEEFVNATSSGNTTEYPTWMRHEERRLVQVSRKLAVKNAMFVVSKDGSSPYMTVQSAIDAAARSRIRGRKVIHVKRGVYRENIYVGPYNDDIMLVGDGMRNTIITSSRSARSGYTTYSSATAGIDGLRFIARDLTIQNAAGAQMGQAVALRSSSDLSVFYKCAFLGYQDTLFVHSQRQFYKMCYIFGTIDVIFGNAAVVFQSCMIYARVPVLGQANVITAQGRVDPNQNTGIVMHGCRIMADEDLAGKIRSVSTYLGRPWQQYSRTIIMRSYMGPLVHRAGWMPWKSAGYLSTLYYAEFGNFGPGAMLRNRVKWPGYHIITRPNAVSQFSVERFIAGRKWLPATGVPFSPGV